MSLLHSKFDIRCIDGMGDPAMREEVRNHRALAVYKRVEAKLTGTFEQQQECLVLILCFRSRL
jgi:hypothetical protein